MARRATLSPCGELLLGAIAEYKPGGQIEDLVWRAHATNAPIQPAVVSSEDGKVTELASRRAAKLPAP